MCTVLSIRGEEGVVKIFWANFPYSAHFPKRGERDEVSEGRQKLQKGGVSGKFCPNENGACVYHHHVCVCVEGKRRGEAFASRHVINPKVPEAAPLYCFHRA